MLEELKLELGHLIGHGGYLKDDAREKAFNELVEKIDESTRKDGTGYIIRKDGDMWMCARDNFINLQESNSEFGETPTIAMANFLQREDEMQREWEERMG